MSPSHASSSETSNQFTPFEHKMNEAGLSEAAVKAFKCSYECLVNGNNGEILESDISPVTDCIHLEGKDNSIRQTITADPSLLRETVVLKLNGGLGTSMGLDKAKSLLDVKDSNTFLDCIAQQILELRKKTSYHVKFYLMNSFSTSQDTLQYLQANYAKDLVSSGNLVDEIELLQNKVPKIDAKTLEPIEWKLNPGKEWCPPGHGDLYAALLGSRKLDKLLSDGIKYMFVSNSDNLGATLDLDLLTYFAKSNKDFIMECCERTENDKKGGHLAIRQKDQRLILRESAQCAKKDENEFQNVSKHRYFNTNNLWIRLDRLHDLMKKHGGYLPLPMIKNVKTVDPKDPSSPQVYQLETAMGAAIENFDNALAVCVPRTRFVPVKKTDDLLLLRSDAYIITPDYRPILSPKCQNIAPVITLDSKHCKFVQQLERMISGGHAVPSLIDCKRLTVTGNIVFSKNVVLQGEITIVNKSNEEKIVRSGVYNNQTIDISDQKGLGLLAVTNRTTTPYEGQKPGTSGLRQKTRTFMKENYLENFVQSTFDSLPSNVIYDGTLVISGDGRYFNKQAIQTIIKMAIASGVKNILLGQDGLLSTPAVSTIIRNRKSCDGKLPFGAFILTASHNPGGIDEDFGIKYNSENGGPAPEQMTNQIYENTKVITSYKICEKFPEIDLHKIQTQKITSDDKNYEVTVEVFDSTEDQVKLLKSIFDFNAIRSLIQRPDFSFLYDCMHGVQGPYARAVFVKELGARPSSIMNDIPREDFGGGHADPNLTYAHDLIKLMGIDPKGNPIFGQGSDVPCFGAACDGDADRNMILGKRFFVTPSDSLAIIAANANVIPYFNQRGGLKGVARSMPTSCAVDLVAKSFGIKCFEVPTGWKFFGNLMDSKIVYGKEDYTPFICGEESFGTGSDHIREKDGMWSVLAWLSILAAKNTDASKPFIGVEEIVRSHWAKFGRNYYCRYDYENVSKPAAESMCQYMIGQAAMFNLCKCPSNVTINGYSLKSIDEFSYHDPVDGSTSTGQGIRFLFVDGSRVVFRLSGTGVGGATIRMYIEKYEKPTGNLQAITGDALGNLIQAALSLSKLKQFTGRTSPTVIT